MFGIKLLLLLFMWNIKRKFNVDKSDDEGLDIYEHIQLTQYVRMLVILTTNWLIADALLQPLSATHITIIINSIGTVLTKAVANDQLVLLCYSRTWAIERVCAIFSSINLILFRLRMRCIANCGTKEMKSLHTNRINIAIAHHNCPNNNQKNLLWTTCIIFVTVSYISHK